MLRSDYESVSVENEIFEHQMRYCCDVMREEMKAGDVVVDDPESGEGAGLTICYFFG